MLENDETSEQPGKKMVKIEGILTFADAKLKKIKLTTGKGVRWTVAVPEGLGDIVKPHWEESVIVQGRKTGDKKMIL